MATTDVFGRLDKRPRRARSAKPLEDGARIAVIGAGPAGSMFSYFLLNMAESVALDLKVDLYEPRHFCHRGPAGCNHCGGVVSESLVQRLATEGIALPDDVVQRGIESYTLHMDVGDVEIATPLRESRIAAIYRGNGPRDPEPLDSHSFDGYLQQLASNRGARLLRRLVTDVSDLGESMRVECADGSHGEYELVAIASGVNSQLIKSLKDPERGRDLPGTTKTFICEFRLGAEVIRETLGPSMHVFLLDIPRLKFAALIPKGDYATLCLLGKDIDDQLMERFFNAPEVARCFPGGVIPRHVCHCYPRINVRSARPPYGDRLVMIGDSGTSRLYKDGIGAAYRTAKAAARTAVFHGVSAKDFRRYYWPLCRKMDTDNRVGKLVFAISNLVQRARFARRGVLRMTANEQQSSAPRRMSTVLWDLFTGSAPYTDVFLRTLHPAYIAGLLWNFVAGNLPGKNLPPAPEAGPARRNGDDRQESPSVVRPFWIHARTQEKTPPCQAQCPNSGDIRGWLGIIAQREKLGLSLEQAYDRSWERLVELNPFPATLGRICPHPCERLCSRTVMGEPVSIKAMERFLGDWGISRKLPLPKIDARDCTESVGVIGSGPASLSFAYQMARRGYPVTIYEKRELPGGMLRHAIPEFRLPQEVLDAEIQRILDLQIALLPGIEAGNEISFPELKARHRLLFLGMGAQSARRLGVEGEAGPGVMSGIKYLTDRKLGIATGLGRRVVVVGGGNTAMDAARSARRDGAEVTLLYRRSLEEMPAEKHEVQDAEAEGVRFEFLCAPGRILRDEMGVSGIEVQRMRLGAADQDGRQRPIPIPGDLFTLEADTVLAAVSQEPAWRGIAEAGDGHKWLHTESDGKLADDLWAGGDDRGPGIASRAVAQGRLAAEAAHAELCGKKPPRLRPVGPGLDPASVKPGYYDDSPRGGTSRRPLERWLAEPEKEIDQTLTGEQACREAARCMSCGLCFGCQQCFMYCNAAGFTRMDEVEPGRYYALALEACEGCGKCIELCPCGYLEPREATMC